MSYRMIETIAGQDHNDDLAKFGERSEIVISWKTPVYENNEIKHSFIVESKNVEFIIEALSRLFELEKTLHNKDDLDHVITVINVDSMLPELDIKNEVSIHSFRKGNRVSTNEILESLKGAMNINQNFILNTIFAIILACVGIILNDKSIFVASATISVAFSPLASYSFLLATADTTKMKNVLKTSLCNVLLSIAISYAFGNLAQFTTRYDFYLSNIRNIFNDIQFNIYNIILAIVSGLASGLAITSGTSTLMASLMLSISMVPVYGMIGLCLSAQYYERAFDMFLLLMINFTFIISSIFFIYYSKNIRPVTREAIEAKKWLYPLNLVIAVLFIFLFWKMQYGF